MVSSFDPRVTIREQIGYTKFIQGSDRSTVSVSDDRDDPRYLPLYLPGECRTGNLVTMPFIEVTLMTSPQKTINIGGNKKLVETYLDFHIFYTDMDNITPTTFGKDIADELCDKIFDNRCSVPNCTWMEVINGGRELPIENDGKQVVFHRVVEAYAFNIE